MKSVASVSIFMGIAFFVLVISTGCTNMSVLEKESYEPNSNYAQKSYLADKTQYGYTDLDASKVVAVSASGRYMFALLEDGTLFTWGGQYVRDDASGEWRFMGMGRTWI